jgi:hypothetical protein
MPPVGFEHIISADERPQTYALDRAVTGTGLNKYCDDKLQEDELDTPMCHAWKKTELYTAISWKSLKERTRLVDLGIEKRITLKCILNKQDVRV